MTIADKRVLQINVCTRGGAHIHATFFVRRMQHKVWGLHHWLSAQNRYLELGQDASHILPTVWDLYRPPTNAGRQDAQFNVHPWGSKTLMNHKDDCL